MSLTFELTTSSPIFHPTPVSFPVPAFALPVGPSLLQPENGGPALPAQPAGDRVVAIIPPQESTKPLRFKLIEAPDLKDIVKVIEKDETLELRLPEGLFSVYHFGQSTPRPYLWPVYGPGGKRVTRNFPMENIEGEKTDHPHHRSITTAFDEVNGVDNWSEGAGHGYTRHEDFGVGSGPVFGEFGASNCWTDAEGKPIMDEGRSVRLYNAGPDWRIFDYGIAWLAKYGEVTINDTKEGGVLSVRVASSMDGVGEGVITSAAGTGEKECWGKASPWCDYSGPVDGEIFGISIFDDADNSLHPTRWHVRDYGLFAINPFSTACFKQGEPTPFTLEEHDSIFFQYRVLIHRGDARQARIEQAYQLFSQPPQVRVVL